MNYRKHILLAAALATLAAIDASADMVTAFEVNIDSTSLVGQTGSIGSDADIYFSFAPGLNSDPAGVSVTNYSETAWLSGTPAFTDGGVTGTLDTNDLAFTNDLYQLNDYAESFTIVGGFLDFNVTFDLPDTLVGSSGSEFDVAITDSLGNPLLTSDPSGYLVELPYDQNGNFTPVVTNSDVATVTDLNTVATPEPRTGALILIGAMAVWMSRRKMPCKSLTRA